MITISKIVDEKVMHKVDHEAIQEVLPVVKEETFVTFVANDWKLKNEVWEEKGVKYVRVVLPFSRVKRLSKQRVLQLMLERYQKLVA
jgi:hypothetical protein